MAQSDPIKILVAEPDAGEQAKLRALLGEAGADWFALEFVADGYAACDRVEEGTYDALFINWGGRGVSAANIKHLRECSPLTSIFVLTGAHDTMVSIVAVRAGAEECFTKGELAGQALRKLVKTTVERHKLQTKSDTDSILRHRRLEKLLRTDEKTGLSNSLHLAQRIDQEILRSTRYRRVICFALMEIDKWSVLKETHGEAFGESLIGLMARTLQANTRKIDECGFIKGAKFGLLLIETGVVQGQIAVQRILADLAKSPMGVAVGPPVYVRLNIGLAAWNPEIKDAAAYIRLAELGLDQAKREPGGRLQVIGTESAV